MRGRSKSVTTIATVAMAAALLVEFNTRARPVAHRSRAAGRSLSMAGDAAAIGRRRSAVRARRSACTASHDGLYMFNSTWHWQPIVNGYSGFFPETFIELAEHTASFPDDRSIEYLKQRGVDLLVIHGSLMEPEEFGEMTAALLARPDIEAMAQFEERMGSGRSVSAEEIVPSTARGVPRPNTADGRRWNLWPLTIVESICCAHRPRWHSDWM